MGPKSLDSERRALCDFLYYAYLPSVSEASRHAGYYAQIIRDDTLETFSDESSARRLLAKIMQERINARGAGQVVIGVTAGYDSRGLLGALSEVLTADQIIAFTKGQEGNEDFDKARLFTSKVTDRHLLVETQEAPFSVGFVVDAYSKRPAWLPKEIAPPQETKRDPLAEFSDCPRITGFLGDALSGKRLGGKVSRDFDLARRRFVDRNRPFLPRELSELFLPPSYDPSHVLPDKPWLPFEVMAFDDQFDLFYRQNQRIRFSANQYSEDEIARLSGHPFQKKAIEARRKSIAPYTDPRWQRSWLMMPLEDRLGQKFYYRFLKHSYPSIFMDLVDPTDPRWAKPKDGELTAKQLSAKRTHTNWEVLFEESASFQRFATDLLGSLRGRLGVDWFDPLQVARLANEQVYGYGTVLWGLLSMEINIRAGLLPNPEPRILVRGSRVLTPEPD